MQKVLVVDDSALMRRKICDIINADRDFHVVDMSVNAADAYNKISRYDYALAVVAVSSRMDVLGLMDQLSKSRAKCKVILLATVLTEDLETAQRAVKKGAYTYVCRGNRVSAIDEETARLLIQALHDASDGKAVTPVRPANVSSAPSPSKTEDPSVTSKRVAEIAKRTAEQIAKMRGADAKTEKNESPFSGNVVGGEVSSTRTTSINEERMTTSAPGMENVPVAAAHSVVALACSTGGPQALQMVIPKLPANLRVPVVLVQHMPAGFTAALAARLDQNSSVHVKEAADGDVLQAGWVYIAPGGKHMRIARDTGKGHRVVISDEAPVNSLKPCADLMYESLCESSYDEIVCVVLTGMGADATVGIKKLASHKKIYVITESQDTCVVYGMPKSIETQGLSDKVVPINQIADAIARKVGD